MENVKFYLRKKDVKGFNTIYLFINLNKKQLFYSTGLKIKDCDWNKAHQRAKRDEVINDCLDKYGEVAASFLKQSNTLDEPSNSTLKQFIESNLYVVKPVRKKEAKNKVVSAFFALIDKFIREAPNRTNANGEKICDRRVRMYVYERQALEEFERKYTRKLSFANFDTDTLLSFQKFLQSKGLSNNTVVRYFKLLWVIFHYAEEHNIELNQSFRKFRLHTNRKDVVVLDENEIQQIWEYVPSNACEANVRKLFLVGLYTGLRFSDYSTLNNANIDLNNMIISTIQNKTGQRVTLPIHPQLAKMLATEELPYTISNEKFNVYVKRMMKKIGFNQMIEIKKIIGGRRVVEYHEKWQLISSHTARRSFATNLYLQGVNPAIIMMLTGHKDLDSFMQYIVLNEEDKLQVVRNIWNAKAV